VFSTVCESTIDIEIVPKATAETVKQRINFHAYCDYISRSSTRSPTNSS
jgi:hypothetical protein